MVRLLTTMRLDTIVQFRNRFYYIGIGVSLVLAAILSAFFSGEDLARAIPMFFLFAVGGTALLYAAGLLIFEKDEGTLDAMNISPLRRWEYMTSKALTLGLLAFIEAMVVVLLTVGFGGYNIVLLLTGVIFMALIHTFLGIALVVRYKSITDFLMPAAAIILVLEMAFLYFLDIFPNPVMLVMPSTAPTMLMWGAWHPLETWEWVYGLGYSILWIGISAYWAMRAYNRYIVLKG